MVCEQSLHYAIVQHTSWWRDATLDAAPSPAVAHGYLILHAVPELATIAAKQSKYLIQDDSLETTRRFKFLV